MLKLYIVVIYCILCIAGAVIKISKHNGKDKSVNLALETVFEFENDPKNTDVNILNNVQRFIGKVRNVIEGDGSGRRQVGDGSKNVFTTFIIDALQILLDFDDRQLEKLVSIISQELNNHHYAGCKFYELADNIEKQTYISNKLAEIQYKPGAQIRDDLKLLVGVLREEIYSDYAKQLIDTINSVYKKDSIGKIQKFLIRLDNYRQKIKQYNNITNIISEGLKTIIFDHYTNLSVHVRSSLLSKLQNYIRYFKDNILQTVNPVSKSKEILQTQREEYLKKENLVTSAHRKHKSKGKQLKRTTISQRPLDVPTTRKLKYEYSKQILRSPQFDGIEKKNRFVKVQRMPEDKPTSSHKKRNSRTTKQLRTFRQMYVEKNIDLKYDADAYEHLSTVKKHKTKRNTFNPTTHKRKKHTHTRETTTTQRYDNEDSDDKDNKGGSDETVVTDFSMDFSSESFKKYKVTKMARNFEQDFNETDENDPFYRSVTKKVTPRPTFVIDWSTSSGNADKQFGVTNEYKERVLNHGSNEGSQLYTYEPGRHGEIKLVKNMDYSIEVRKRKNWELDIHRKTDSKHMRQKKEHLRQDSPKGSDNYVLKTGKLDSEYVSVMRRQGGVSGEKKPKMAREPIIFAQQYEVPLHFRGKVFRRQFSRPRTVSKEGLSIEELGNDRPTNSYRRNIPTSKEDYNINKQVLKRIQKLEKDLELVKVHINDREQIKLNKSATLGQDKDKLNEKEIYTKRSNLETTLKKDINEAHNINVNKEQSSKTFHAQIIPLGIDSTTLKSLTASSVQQPVNNVNESKVEMENEKNDKGRHNASGNDTLTTELGSKLNQSSLVNDAVYKERRFNIQNGKKTNNSEIIDTHKDIGTQTNNSLGLNLDEEKKMMLRVDDAAKTIDRYEEIAANTIRAIEKSEILTNTTNSTIISVPQLKIDNERKDGVIEENTRNALNLTSISNITKDNLEDETNNLMSTSSGTDHGINKV